MKSSIAVALALLAVFALGQCDGRNRAGKTLRAEMARLESEKRTDTVRVVDSVFRRDTVRLRSVLTKWDSVRVRDTLTVWRHDTAVVYVERSLADSSINFCRVTLGSCTRSLVARDSLIQSLRSELRAVASDRPNVIQVWGGRLLWAGAGYLAGRR